MKGKIRVVSKYSFGGTRIHGGMMINKTGSDYEVFTERASEMIVVLIDTLPSPTGKLIAENVTLVSPVLGRPPLNRIEKLHQDQLKWLAQTWLQLCANPEETFGKEEDAAPLLICANGRPILIITTTGEIKKVK